VTPTYAAWKLSGAVLAELSRSEGLELHRLSRSFVNDVLLAVSCRESGLTLVTDNRGDFARIRRVIAFDFVTPWPRPSS
jgi:predicted nucleic acid-binding protein